MRKSSTTKKELEGKTREELYNLILMLFEEKYRLECMLHKFENR